MTQPSFTDEQAMEVWLEALEATGTFIRFKPKYARVAATIIRDTVNAVVAERDAEIARLKADKLRLERAIIRLAAPNLLTKAEREALEDFIKFLRDGGDDTVNQAMREPKNISPKERFK